MSRLSVLKKIVVPLLLFCFCLTGIASAQDGIPEEADKAFWEILGKLEENGEIESGGNSTYYGDYEDEWAQLSWYQWITFEKAERFVLSSTLSWDSASQTPNNFESGCGVIFNGSDTSDDHLLASLRMDGLIYFTGKRNHQDLSYGTYKFGSPSIKKTVDLVLVVDRDKASVYVDGQRVVRKANMYDMGDAVGLCTLSGTNKDFGTRCSWKDIFFYTW